MRSATLQELDCPIASALQVVGEWWTLLIVRDALDGFTRFEEFERSLGIAPNMLTRRLRALVDDGILQRRRYCERPPRDEYVLTRAGRDLRPVVQALYWWGDRHCDASAGRLALVDPTGAQVDPVMVDRVTGRELDGAVFAPGPAAGERMRARFDRVRR